MAIHPHFLWTDLFKKEASGQKNVIHHLKENVLFCTLYPKELKYLAGMIYERVYQPGEPVFHQNDRGLGMYFLVKGQVAIKTRTSGDETLVTTLTDGSIFGEISLVEPESIRTASAICVERSIVIGFFKPDLIEILERKPSMGVRILFQLSMVLGRRLQESTEKIAQLSHIQEATVKPDEKVI